MDDVAEQLPTLLATDLDGGFTELVRIYAGAVHAFLLRVSGSPAEAEDLGQDTFLRAYRALADYSPERCRQLRLRAWLMTIAANIWRNHVRTRVRRPMSAANAEDLAERWSDAQPGPEDNALTADDRSRLVQALAQLPEKYRIPVVLRHVNGMSYVEIAHVQGNSVGTTKAQVSRGLQRLRRLLEPDVALLKEVGT